MLHILHIIYKDKGKAQPITRHEAPGEQYRYSFTLSLTWALGGVGGQRHVPGALLEDKRPGTLFIGAWVDHRAGLDGAAYLAPPGFDPDSPAHSESLYQLNYHGSQYILKIKFLR